MPMRISLGLDITGPSAGGRAPVSAAWTPADLGAALKAYWHADDTANGTVSTWTDRVASLAVTATAGLEPISAAISFNSAYRGLTFDGTDDCLVTTVLTGLPTGATGGEIWALVSNNVPGTNAAARLAVAYGSTATNVRGLYRFGVSNVARFRFSDGTVFTTDTVASLESGGHVLGANWAGTTQAGRVDGQDSNPASATIATLATGTARLRIGAFTAAAAASFWSGVIRTVLITTTLTNLQRQQIEGWMVWNSGLSSILPADHPYKSAAP